MDFAVPLIAALAVAAFVAIVAAIVLWRQWRAAQDKADSLVWEKSAADSAIVPLNAKLEAAEADKNRLAKELTDAHGKHETAQDEMRRQAGVIGKLESALASEKEHGAEKIALLENAQENMKIEFKNLANEILREESKQFGTDSKQLLDPLTKELGSFRTSIDNIYSKETEARASLKTEITLLHTQAVEISKDANNLTRALKGDKKAQGDWGEIMLETLLQDSGLRENEEYETQVTLRDENGKLLRPDVVVRLPDDKRLVVDSKVSLAAYTDYVAAEAIEDKDKQQADAIKRHVQAVRNHIDDLSDKNYGALLNSPGFVFMFMRIEPSFFAALAADWNLFTDAYNKKIIICSPTTLMAVLRTVGQIWRQEKQNRNAEEIAQRGRLLYDKFCGFIEDMKGIQEHLKKSQESFDSAANKLQGRGGLIGQAKKLRELGVDSKKTLSKVDGD